METTLVLIACAVGGMLIGSFLTVVVDRVPRGASIVAPGSACGACNNRLTAPDLVPVASWLALQGRCRHCGTGIGIETLAIEVTTAAMFVALGLHFGASVELVAFAVLGAALVALACIDLRIQRLPREITYVAMAIGAPILGVAALVERSPERIAMMLLGAVISLASMATIYAASRGGMGAGDVRLAPLLGMYLGWLNPGLALVGLFFGFFMGAVIGVVMIVIKRGDRKTALPFGPFLATGTMLAVFLGQPFIDLVLAR
jgi:leader peptidase (prepilin peptidase)/N-methyltransferase